MSLPLKTHDVADWIRRAAIAINQLSRSSYYFTPSPQPSNPVKGQTYYDQSTNKVRTYDGTAWNDHW